jgi:hypothetical protein
MPDYIAAFKASPKDLVHYGVKGQRWGIRRSSSQLRSAAKARGDAPAKKSESKDDSSTSTKKADAPDKVETSTERYARLAGQAKAGQASAMSEADLKFFNARTEALAKVNKLNETNPSWLRDTTTKVIQQSAQRQMQTLADTLADKYVGDPLKLAVKGASPKKKKS